MTLFLNKDQVEMSLFNPKIFENYQEFHTASSNAENNDFFVGPYDFSKKNFKKSKSLCLLFDLPTEIVVTFDNTTIPGSCFDYFNPLLINSHILKKIKFINKNDLSIVNSFKCYILTSKILNTLKNTIMITSIYYPPAYTVEYNSIKASLSGMGKQICDILSVPVIQPPIITGIPPPVPMMGRGRPIGNPHPQPLPHTHGIPILDLENISVEQFGRMLHNIIADNYPSGFDLDEI